MKCESSASCTGMCDYTKKGCRMQSLMLQFLGWGPQRCCLSNDLTGDADGLDPWTTLKKQDSNLFVQC